MKTSLGFVLGCLSIGAYASLGACSSPSSANGGGDRGASSGSSSSVGSSGSSGSGGSSGGGSSSGGSSGGGSSSGRNSSGGSTGGSSGSSSGGGSTSYFGVIGAIMASLGGNTVWIGSAGFSATPASACMGTQSGNCCYTPPGSGTGNTLTYVSAGDIVVKDGSTAIATMSPTTQGGVMNTYIASSKQDASYQWAGGDTLSFNAAGGTVNAFSGTVVAPGLMQNINPALGGTMSTMVPASSDFTVTWTPGATSGAASSIVVSATKGTTSDGSIYCSGMDSAGSITVPQALLAKMTTGDGVQIVLTRLVSSSVKTGNVNVVIDVSAETLGAGQLR